MEKHPGVFSFLSENGGEKNDKSLKTTVKTTINTTLARGSRGKNEAEKESQKKRNQKTRWMLIAAYETSRFARRGKGRNKKTKDWATA